MNLNEKHIESALALTAKERYSYFVKNIVDWQEVWSLYHKGYALTMTQQHIRVFPLWPAKEFAYIRAVDEWESYKPRSFTLEELYEDLLPKLKSDHILLGIFDAPNDPSVVVSIDQLIFDLQAELIGS